MSGPPFDHRLPGHNAADRRCISIDPAVEVDDDARCEKCAEARILSALDPFHPDPEIQRFLQENE